MTSWMSRLTARRRHARSAAIPKRACLRRAVKRVWRPATWKKKIRSCFSSPPKFPEFFHDEAERRSLWSSTNTRAKLLEGLAEKGFGSEQMVEMQRIIDAEKSDLFDVLAHVAFALTPLTREERAARTKLEISTHLDNKQQAFLEFVLAQYVKEGVGELNSEKLSSLWNLKYNNAIADAVADLGQPERIKDTFTDFRKYLYQGTL